jgi:hypothetical protein
MVFKDKIDMKVEIHGSTEKARRLNVHFYFSDLEKQIENLKKDFEKRINELEVVAALANRQTVGVINELRRKADKKDDNSTPLSSVSEKDEEEEQ